MGNTKKDNASMITEHKQMYGDLSDSHKIAREAGVQEERQRILVEIVLALDNARLPNSFGHWVAARDALLDLKTRVENPRPQEELNAELLKSIKKVALPHE